MSKVKYVPKRIAFRLASGNSRMPTYSGLPEELKTAITKIAEKENSSRSWVIEQILLDWCGISVKYIERKRNAKVKKG